MKHLVYIFSLILISTTNCWALDLAEAKASGLIGEGNKAFLGFVTQSPSSEIQALVKEVNEKRKSKFASAAKSTGATIQQVTKRFYSRAIAATKSGDYYQDAAGNWIKKQ